ncbi:MAG: hypothetical protein JO273_03965 [Methylobacteriaceae bacterium]|nr:hypothetical protein [Methylobacteriaceae bacterium]
MKSSAPAVAPEAGWRVARDVPLALIAAIVFQTIGIVWYFSKLDSRVKIIEDARAANVAQIGKIIEDRDLTHTRLTTVEVRLEAILEGIRRIETRLDAAGSAAK